MIKIIDIFVIMIYNVKYPRKRAVHAVTCRFPHDSTEFVGTGYDSLQAVVVPIGLRFINVDSLRLRSSKRKRQEV